MKCYFKKISNFVGNWLILTQMKSNFKIGAIINRSVIILSAIIFSFSTIANGNEPKELVVWLKTGERVQLKLSESLKTTFANGNMVIESESASFQWPMESVIKYTYNLPLSSIESPIAPNDIKVSYLNKILTIETNQPKVSVKLWGTNGLLIDSWNFNVNSKMSISLTGYTAGIYVLEINGYTHKIII